MSLARVAQLFMFAAGAAQASFGMKYGNNPKAHNGGQPSGVAAHKRAARKRRNIRKHPRSAT